MSLAVATTARVQEDSLYTRLQACTACALHSRCQQVVPGAGPAPCKWMFIAEAPGQQEDEQGFPFAGKAGCIYDAYLDQLGLASEEVYVTNVVKHRPPHNRDPKPDEIRACTGFLLEELRQVKPRYIVALGAVAHRTLTREPLIAVVQQLHAEVHHVIHPSAILHEPHERIRAYHALRDLRRSVDALRPPQDLW